MFSCTLQIRTSVGQHSFEFLTFFLFAKSVIFVCRQLAVVSFCVPLPQIVGITADFSRWGYMLWFNFILGLKKFCFPLFLSMVVW